MVSCVYFFFCIPSVLLGFRDEDSEERRSRWSKIAISLRRFMLLSKYVKAKVVTITYFVIQARILFF